MDKNLDTALIVDICVALRQGREEEAQAGWLRLLALAKQETALESQAAQATLEQNASNAAWLQQVGICLLTAARVKNTQLAQQWLKEPALVAAFKQPELAQFSSELLVDLAFAVCDRRQVELQPELWPLARAWLKSAQGWQQVDALLGELLNLAARMARRGWQSEARFALRLVVRMALTQREPAFWQALLARFNLHFTGFAHWDGFPKACKVYAELALLLLILVRRAGRASEPETQRIAYLQLALRSVRAWVTNISRSTMQEDMDIFRQWYQFMWQLAGEDARRKQQLLLLLQLSIKYWHSTLPKSSKKQLRFLQDLLEPNLVSEAYEALLKRIV